jgi:hypothetical protein
MLFRPAGCPAAHYHRSLAAKPELQPSAATPADRSKTFGAVVLPILKVGNSAVALHRAELAGEPARWQPLPEHQRSAVELSFQIRTAEVEIQTDPACIRNQHRPAGS